jgi:type 1 glutamine amidotransferase
VNISRRRCLQRLGASGLGLAAAAGLPAWAARAVAAPAASTPLRICLLSGSEEYKSNESLAEFQKFLERHYPIKCSRAFWTASDNLPGLEALEATDVALIFTKRLKIAGEQLDAVKKYCLAGRPIVGLRTASHAFQNWLELDHDIMGGDYQGHYGDGLITKVSIAKGAADHPVLAGVEPFESSSKLYKNPRLAGDATLLLNGAIPEHVEPLAWTRNYRKARVFYTSLGGPDDFTLKPFRRLLVNALFWTTNRNNPHPAAA